MHCPFPGMDPLIEADNWQDFHVILTAEIKRQIGPQLPERYRISAELIGFVEETSGATVEPPRQYRPDAGISTTGGTDNIIREGGAAVALTPPSREIEGTALRQRELRIYDRHANRLVAAIEVLSPSNKRGVGRASHLLKLVDYHRAGVHTIDIDLLRGGSLGYHPALAENAGPDIQQTPYHVVLVSDSNALSIWDITLTDILPTIPVPLLAPDPPVVLDLQRAFTELYSYSTYPKRSVADLAALHPPLAETEQQRLSTYLEP